MKVFRLQDGTKSSLKQDKDWFVSAEYTTNEIIAIPDPDGGKGNEPTSIPSPFARMDLANTAFRYVNDLGDDAGYMYQKIVSDCLDIAEIFFNFHIFQADIKIIEWDKTTDIQKLLNTNTSEHIKLAETLKMYLENKEDANAFNFNQVQKIYLIKYKHHIIGGTSPLTLFFNTANDLAWTDIIFSNGDKAFDTAILPLNQRVEDFQIWLYGMRCSFSNFAGTFRELSAYMDKNLAILQTQNNSLFNQINNLDSASYNHTTYDVIGNGLTSINGLPIFQSRQLSGTIPIVSDFEIATTKYKGLRKPLALQHGHKGITMNAKPMRYFNAPYIQTTNVPYHDDRQISNRTLPGLSNVVYPYLTVSDFLEPYLIRTIYPINKEKFFDGNYKKGSYKEDKGFILPLKKTFFEYFDISDLQKNINGRPMFQFESLASGTTTATLRIPIVNGNYIEFKREYQKFEDDGSNKTPDLNLNEGVIVENQFGLGLFPCIRFEADENPEYRIALIDRDISPMTLSNTYNLEYYQQNDTTRSVPITDVKRRNKKNAQEVETNFYILKSNFDFIELAINNAYRGIVIPIFSEKSRTKQFTFAVDFGTTNTHVEYSVDGVNQPFNINSNDIQIAKLHSNDIFVTGEIRSTFDHDLVPEIIEPDGQYSFPMRTVLSESNTANYDLSVFPLADVSIPFIYERDALKHYNTSITNLKWSSDKKNSKQVELFLDNLLLLIRNKVILNGGKLSDTKIVWFYPASMLEIRFNRFRQIWESLFLKNIGTNVANLVAMSESVAPFYYYRSTQNATRDVVSIDIGGGTTDIIIFEGTTPTLLTSFRFAADAIFGDGYGSDSNRNGFVQEFKDEIINVLTKNGLEDLYKAYNSIEPRKRSTDIIAFFFSLANNKDVKNKNIQIHFEKMLEQCDKYKIVFILFFASIIYHLATIMKAKNMAMPRYLTFSGTGSKTLQILTPDNSTLESFTKLIFEKIFHEKYDSNGLTLIFNSQNPKEATCKGGICSPISQSYDNIKGTLIGIDTNSFANKNTKYNNITSSDLGSIVSETRKFIEFVFSLNEEFSFSNKFGAAAGNLDLVKTLCLKDIKKNLQDGLDKKHEELKQIDSNQPIEETLFFYPLTGILNSLVHEINKQK